MGRLEVKCAICDTPFQTTEYLRSIGRGKYCTNQCRHVAKSRQLSGSNSIFWKGGANEINCIVCNEKFIAAKSRTHAKFCSTECHGKWKSLTNTGENNPSWKNGGVALDCEVCGSSFKVTEAVVGRRRFCSMACKAESQKKEKIVLTCETCNQEFDRFPSEVEKSFLRGEHGSFCSKECYGHSISKRQAGAANPSWRGGVTPENKRIRDSKEIAAWRTAVFVRDNYACRHCGARNAKGVGQSVKLHAHHIKGFAAFPDLRFDIDNGLTLCEPCHYKVHSR